MTIQESQAHVLRRFLPRQFADWSGTYRAGADLELLDAPTDVVVGAQILVAIQLEGEIRNARTTRVGHIRVGTQFVNLSDAERLFLQSQEQLAVHW